MTCWQNTRCADRHRVSHGQNDLLDTKGVGQRSRFLADPSRTLDDVEYATMQWVDWYNNRQLHSLVHDIPPEEYEAAY